MTLSSCVRACCGVAGYQGATRADRRSESDTGLVSETKETAAADNGVTVGDKGESMRGFERDVCMCDKDPSET